MTYFVGGPRCVTKCDRGKGVSTMVKHSVTYFMDGPYTVLGMSNHSSNMDSLPVSKINPFLLGYTCKRLKTHTSKPRN